MTVITLICLHRLHGYGRVYLPLCEVADTHFHITGGRQVNRFLSTCLQENVFYLALLWLSAIFSYYPAESRMKILQKIGMLNNIYSLIGIHCNALYLLGRIIY